MLRDRRERQAVLARRLMHPLDGVPRMSRALFVQTQAWAHGGPSPQGSEMGEALVDSRIADGAVSRLVDDCEGWWLGDASRDLEDGRIEGCADPSCGCHDADGGMLGVSGFSSLGRGRSVVRARIDPMALAPGGIASVGARAARVVTGRALCSCDGGGVREEAQALRAAGEQGRRSLIALGAALELVARSRAVLASRLAVGGDRVSAFLVAPVTDGTVEMLVTGLPPRRSTRWMEAIPFHGSVRTYGARGKMIAVGGEMGGIWCSLCGGAPAGPVDEWAQEHPLSVLARRGQ